MPAVLIVEPSPRLGSVLEAIVQDELGCSTRWLQSRAEARHAAEESQTPLLVILELEQHLTATVEVAQYWRERHPNVPIIATGYADGSALAAELGCAFLGRPFPFEQFVHLLRQAASGAKVGGSEVLLQAHNPLLHGVQNGLGPVVNAELVVDAGNVVAYGALAD